MVSLVSCGIGLVQAEDIYTSLSIYKRTYPTSRNRKENIILTASHCLIKVSSKVTCVHASEVCQVNKCLVLLSWRAMDLQRAKNAQHYTEGSFYFTHVDDLGYGKMSLISVGGQKMLLSYTRSLGDRKGKEIAFWCHLSFYAKHTAFDLDTLSFWGRDEIGLLMLS